MTLKQIISLRMERQFLSQKANKEEYIELFKDTQPGQNVYWNGFGTPPNLVFRTDFNDMEFNRARILDRKLIKGRFCGGNIGWIMKEDIELFAAVYKKPLKNPSETTLKVLDIIEREGPANIQFIKEETGLLVKEITPALHKLQEAFLVYEDQYNGEWDRGWMRFDEMFPNVNLDKYTKTEAIKILLLRFSKRMVAFTLTMAKNFYRIPEKEIKLAVSELIDEELLKETEFGFVLTSDIENIEKHTESIPHSIYAIHRNDIMYKANETELKQYAEKLCDGLEYDHEPLQYLLIDGVFQGVVAGHFRNGPYDLNDVRCNIDKAENMKDEIIEAVKKVNFGHSPVRFMGKELQ